MQRESIKEGSWKFYPNQGVDQEAVVLDQGIGMTTEAGIEAAAAAVEGMTVIGILIEIGIHVTGAGVAAPVLITIVVVGEENMMTGRAGA